MALDYSSWDKSPVLYQEGPPPKNRSLRIPKTPRPLVEIPDAPRFLMIPGGPSHKPVASEIRFRNKAIDMSGLSAQDDEETGGFETEDVDVEVVMKLGGAAITDKSTPETVRADTLAKIVSHVVELRESMPKKRGIILVHGAGSFGHHTASKYAIHRGLIFHPKAVMGYAKTRLSVQKLNNLVVAELVSQGIPAVAVAPSDFLRTHDTKSNEISFVRMCEHIRTLLGMGLLPVIHGDVMVDTLVGCSILSGDTIIKSLTRTFRPKRCIFSTDRDGVYDIHPDLDGAQLIRNILVKSDGSIDASVSFDNTAAGSLSKSDDSSTDSSASPLAPFSSPHPRATHKQLIRNILVKSDGSIDASVSFDSPSKSEDSPTDSSASSPLESSPLESSPSESLPPDSSLPESTPLKSSQPKSSQPKSSQPKSSPSKLSLPKSSLPDSPPPELSQPEPELLPPADSEAKTADAPGSDRKSRPADVTGEMKAKLKYATSCALRGARVFIVRGGSAAERCALMDDDPQSQECTVLTQTYAD